jgi:DNA (cytosine-5)-methyltransferase 1
VNCEGDEGPAVSMFGGIPAFGGHGLGGSIERSATLTAKDTRLDIESETFLVQPDVVGALTSHAYSGGAGGRPDGAAAGHFLAVAPSLRAQAQSSHRADSEAFIVAGTLNANGKAAGSATQQDAESGLLVVHGTQDPGYSDRLAFALGRNNGAENAVLAFSCKDNGADAGALAPTLRAMNHSGSHANAGGQVAVCITGDITHTLKADGFDGSEDGTGRGQPITAGASGVRRLLPRECERLQGMPDDYTLIPWRGKPAKECPDGPRYKAIGNSKAVTVVRWIGQRILRQIKTSPYG